MKHMPGRLPGGGFKKIAPVFFADRDKLHEIPVDFSKEQTKPRGISSLRPSRREEVQKGMT
jgi:hypothetical protein